MIWAVLKHTRHVYFHESFSAVHNYCNLVKFIECTTGKNQRMKILGKERLQSLIRTWALTKAMLSQKRPKPHQLWYPINMWRMKKYWLTPELVMSGNKPGEWTVPRLSSQCSPQWRLSVMQPSVHLNPESLAENTHGHFILYSALGVRSTISTAAVQTPVCILHSCVSVMQTGLHSHLISILHSCVSSIQTQVHKHLIQI